MKKAWMCVVLILALEVGGFINPCYSADAVKIYVKATGYCPCAKCCGPNSKGKTSKGVDAKICTGVAADPKALPYGTVLDIPGIGHRVVDDTGGAMRQDWKKGIVHIDVRFSDHNAAKQFGVKWLNVTILEKPK